MVDDSRLDFLPTSFDADEPVPLYRIVSPDALRQLTAAFGAVDKPIERITQPDLCEAYTNLAYDRRTPTIMMYDIEQEIAGLLHTLRNIENQAAWLVLRSRRSDEEIFTLSDTTRRINFLDDLYGNPAKWSFFKPRARCINTLANDGLISRREYVQ